MKKNPTGRALRATLLALAIPASILGILSLPLRPEPPAGPPRVTAAAAGRGPLRAGAAARTIELGSDPLIAGFPHLTYAAAGVRDPVTARALVLEEAGCTVAIASAEILLVAPGLEREVRARLADLRLDGLILGATHTHAGPGGFWDGLVAERAATGPYRPAALARIADAIAAAVRAARAAAGPATLSVARGADPSLVWNRDGGRRGGRILALRLSRPGGEPLAELVVVASHPTLLGGANRLISGDWVGRFLAASRGGVRLLLQGALGDQSPLGPPAPPGRALETYAAALDRDVAALPSSPADAAPVLRIAEVEVDLPAVSPGAVPPLLRPAARTLLGGALPATARVAALRLGDALLLAAPGEPVEEVGRGWCDAAGPGAAVVGLAGGYLGYVETPAAFLGGRGEAVRSYYGPDLAARLGAGLLAAVRAADRPPGR